MTHQELIQVFHNTQTLVKENPRLWQLTVESTAASRLYLEGYESPLRRQKGSVAAEVIPTTTFQCARDSLGEKGKIAVLSFANPREPGGGVLLGARAQEECLCRCSNLYNTLIQPYFRRHYYQYHYTHCDNYFSDRLIWSPNVAVLKSDDPVPKILPDPFFVDVITCAAPYLPGGAMKTGEELLAIYKSRIRNILEAAMANDVDILILGAFGCGAFQNKPELMAKAFRELLIGEQYARYFKSVKFAIKPTGQFCPNLRAFEEAFL